MADDVISFHAKCDQWAAELVGQGGKTTRQAFAALYDEYVTAAPAQEGGQRPRTFMAAIITEGKQRDELDPSLLRNDERAVALALSHLGDEVAVRAFLLSKLADIVTLETGETKAPSSIGTKPQKPISAETPEELTQFIAKAGVNLVSKPWAWSAAIEFALSKANARVCTVRCYKGDEVVSTGTGWLVGPSAVITNWHVVNPVLDANSQQFTDDSHRIRLVFNTSLFCHADRSAPLLAMSLDALSAGATAGGQPLDFAILRIDKAVGLIVGHYSLESAMAPTDEDCICIHVPGGIARSISWGTITAPQQGSSTLSHTATTAKGSSGGIVMGIQGEPLGLHFGRRKQGDPNSAKLATALNAIWANIRNSPAASRLAEVGMPYIDRATLPDGSPVLARGELLQHLKTAMVSKIPVINITSSQTGGATGQPQNGPAPKLGRSFCKTVFESALESGKNIWVRLTPSDIPPRPEELYGLLAARLKLAPEVPPRDTSDSAYAQRLAGQFLGEVTKGEQPFTLWIVLDDLDRGTLPDTDVRTFLTWLYRKASQTDKLKFILIGARTEVLAKLGLTQLTLAGATMIPDEPEPAFLEYPLAPMDKDSIQASLIEWIQARRGGLDPWPTSAVQAMSSICVNALAGADYLPEVSSFVRERVHDILG